MASPSAPRANLQSIAQQAGVSISTVSMALANHPHINVQTKQRIRELSRELGYRRRPRATTTRPRVASEAMALRLGFLLVGSSLEDEAHAHLLAGLNHASTACRARLEIRATPPSNEPAADIEVARTYSRSLDGLILSGRVDSRLMDELETGGIPHVVIGHVMGETASQLTGRLAQIVTGDECRMAEAAVAHLIAQGHQKIGFVCEIIFKGLWNDRWLRGYRRAVAEANLETDERWAIVTDQPLVGGAPAAEAIAQLKNRPTAYVIPDVRVAATFRQAMSPHGQKLTSRDIVISGVDRLRTTYGMIDFPWIGYDHEQVALVAVRQISYLCREPMPCLTEVIVPFVTKNVS